MTPEAQAITQALLDHHRSVGPAETRPENPDPYTIQYGKLCERAGVPWLTRSVGQFLQETAEWCAANGWPPINSLAVNETGMPGGGYDIAPGCSLLQWPEQVRNTIVCRSYPKTVS